MMECTSCIYQHPSPARVAYPLLPSPIYFACCETVLNCLIPGHVRDSALRRCLGNTMAPSLMVLSTVTNYIHPLFKSSSDGSGLVLAFSLCPLGFDSVSPLAHQFPEQCHDSVNGEDVRHHNVAQTPSHCLDLFLCRLGLLQSEGN